MLNNSYILIYMEVKLINSIICIIHIPVLWLKKPIALNFLSYSRVPTK